jgi:hypothetical protein
MGKKLRPFPPNSRTRQKCLLVPLLFNTLVESLARERNKRDISRKERTQIIPICRWFDPIFKRP